MKSYEEIAVNVFKRRDEYNVKRKKKNSLIIYTVTSVLCCVVLITSLVVVESGIFYDIFSKINTLGNHQSELSKPENPSESSSSSNKPSLPPITNSKFVIDSIDKINFYAAKKIISENSLLPISVDINNNPNVIPLNNYYTEYPIDRNKVFTITMVTYFNIELNDENGFLAQKLGGTGLVEVIVTENNIEDMEQMITFKRSDNYYTCFMNGQTYDPDYNKVSREFSSHIYIDGFNIVKNKEQENYTFTVQYEGSKVVGFECAPFHSVPTNYVVDNVTLNEYFCIVYYTNRTFTIDELEVYFKNDNISGAS